MQPHWQLTEFGAPETDWSLLIQHLKNVKMLNHATINGQPKPNCYYLGIIINRAVIGHIAIKRQPIHVPASHISGHEERSLAGPDGNALYEAFVQTFAVEEGYRRTGYGRALQEAALQKAQELGCYQMRSWSSADKLGNYALKIRLGFSIIPALYPMPGGEPISGVYFVKRIEHLE
ncbi:MAG: GNAT family N-acetyltransferase [Anaerolineaceae bacterium]|nr:GNAT family N-acetyltransferase [Anaerolineaceae bacterium]